MGIKARVKLLALRRRGILVRKASTLQDLGGFIRRFQENFVSVDLIRIGGESDGGYLVPVRALGNIQYCFSPGVSDTADFENQLANTYGIKSYLADASVSAAPIANDRFHFTRRFLGSAVSDNFMSLTDWVNDSVGSTACDMLLQMDIEGAEYDVLINESESTLHRFSIMVIEFHNLQNLLEENCLTLFTSIFEKIYRSFSICHVHPNNCCGVSQLGEIQVPNVIEVTFLRKDLAAQLSIGTPVSLPHRLDARNISGKADIKMPEAWWKESPSSW